MASEKSLEKAEKIVTKLFYIPAFTADDMVSTDKEDERVIIIATALDEARSEAIEECVKVAETRFSDQIGILKVTGERIANDIRKLKSKEKL